MASIGFGWSVARGYCFWCICIVTFLASLLSTDAAEYTAVFGNETLRMNVRNCRSQRLSRYSVHRVALPLRVRRNVSPGITTGFSWKQPIQGAHHLLFFLTIRRPMLPPEASSQTDRTRGHLILSESNCGRANRCWTGREFLRPPGLRKTQSPPKPGLSGWLIGRCIFDSPGE
jgi:hypothetical protein